jgi:flavin-dependent dehydrogenase
MASSSDCDVLICGGGPAGSAAAAWLARAGRRVVLLERDRFPRFHIGESLLASVNDVFRAIGAEDLVRGAGFTQKWGATFLPADGSIERHLDFGSAPGVGRPQTWQVPRAAFDELLLRHSAACGTDVREQQRVVDLAFDADGVTATVQSGNGTQACGRARLSTRPAAARCSDASSACASTSRGSPTSPCSRTSPASRGRRDADPGTSASSRATISAGSG